MNNIELEAIIEDQDRNSKGKSFIKFRPRLMCTEAIIQVNHKD